MIKKFFLALFWAGVFGINAYQIHTYNSMQEYVEVQTAGNKKKINNIWARESCIKMLAGYLKKNIPNLAFGICHGTRRGLEQKWFKKYLGIRVIGTEISDTAALFEDTIQWDFHKVKDEWVGAVDFIYSNSFDHTYNPEFCLDQWMKCLKRDGVCILEWTWAHNTGSELDPFGANLDEYKRLIAKKYVIKEILHTVLTKLDAGKTPRERFFFVIEKK